MKRTLALLLLVVLSVTILTGCGNAVFDDFENFLNVEMVDVNENYEKIKTETGRWENFADDDNEAFENSLENVLLPLIDDSLSKLEKITPETDEVIAVKDKYVEVMEAYKEAFEDVLEGFREFDEDKILSGNEKLDKGVKLLDEYNAALEALAEEVGAEIEY